MKIIRIDLSRYPNEEVLRIILEVLEVIEKFDATNLGIEKLYAQLKNLCQKLDELQEVIRKSIHTEEMEEIDKLLDSAIRGFIGVISSSQRQPNEAKRKAARELYIMAKQYMKLLLEGSYAKETAAVHNFRQDLRGPYATQVALLGFGDWVTAIEEAEDKFLSTHELRIQESIDKPKREARKVRTQIMPVYQAIINTSDANLVADGLGGAFVVDPDELDTGSHEDGDPTPPYLRGNINYNFVIALNEVLKKYRNLLAQRDGRRNAHKEDDEDDDE